MNQHDARIAAVAASPPELSAYREWLAAHDAGGPRDYLFTEKRTRFEPRREDVVVAAGELTVSEAKGKTLVRCREPGIMIPVPDVAPEDARRMVELIDGERCLLEVQLDGELAPAVMARLLRATFGRVVLAPQAVEELEDRISGLEITRFPGLPYGIVRAYWTNMAAVRDRLGESPPAANGFVDWLRWLHVVTLMGERLDSFYKPASPGADRLVAPGALFLQDVVVREGRRGTLFLSGPRVNAKLIGGDAYHRAVYRSVGDDDALTRTETITEDGTPWGRVVIARSERDSEPGPWFCPPRPIGDAHLRALHEHLVEALSAGDQQTRTRAAGRFHWCFVRLHPFHNGNQSLAMNLANAALQRAGGAGIPHLVLDHFALRLKLEPYLEVFSRAVRAYGTPGRPSERMTALMKKNDASYRFIDKVSRPDAELEALTAEDPEGAAAALLA